LLDRLFTPDLSLPSFILMLSLFVLNFLFQASNCLLVPALVVLDDLDLLLFKHLDLLLKCCDLALGFFQLLLQLSDLSLLITDRHLVGHFLVTELLRRCVQLGL
jgi:hypothetical protein